MTDSIKLGTDGRGAACALALRYANRHLLVTGATGSGKSVSVMRICDELTRQGVPILAFDAKGDLAGLAMTREGAPRFARLLDAFGLAGDRAALSFAAMGADATARALGLSFAQSGALDMAFDAARRAHIPLHTPDNLKVALARVGADKASKRGYVSAVSVSVIFRALLRVDDSAFHGARFDPLESLQVREGVGRVTIYDARRLADSGPLYGAAICQCLESLYRDMPEIGDAPRPRLALVIDEAHLLFAGIEPQLLARIERIVRLIRSKGVALIFASQAPGDIPPTIAAQCASRVQHALRAVTPADMRGVQVAAESLPGAPPDAARVIGTLKPGEALASLVGLGGAPTNCVRVRVALPACRLGALSDHERTLFRTAPASGHGSQSGELLPAAPGEALQVAGAIAVLSIIAGAIAYLGGFRNAGLVALFAVTFYIFRRPLWMAAIVLGFSHHHHAHHHRHGRHRH